MKAKARRLSEKDFPPLSPTTRRLIGKRPPRRHFLIVCEGEVTEPAYFEELRNRLPPEMVERIVLQGVGRGTTQLLKETEALVERRKYDNKPPYYYVWLVFDKDDFPDFDKTIHAIEDKNAAAKASKTPPYWFAAWSNEAFELWYLLHFQDASGGALRRSQYCERLSQWLNRPYKKNDHALFQLLEGHMVGAIQRADPLLAKYDHTTIPYSQRNPATNVVTLVKELLRYRQ